MNTNYCVVYCTAPDSATAERLAQQIVQLKLAACVNIIPHMTSFFSWQGEMVKSCESLLMIKTHTTKLDDLERHIKAEHPYDVAEFVALPIMYGSESYLNWVNEVQQLKNA